MTGLLIGLAAGLLAFGGTGFFVGRLTVDSAPAARVTPSAGASPSLRAYEATQLTKNRTRFSGDLATFAEPWLSNVSSCRKNGDRNGPSLNDGEVARVQCTYGSMSIYFIQYESTAERDKVRIKNLGQNVDARELTPGAKAGEEDRETPSGRSKGSYIEYAFQSGRGASKRTVSGLWWDDADKPVGAFLLGFWKDGLAEDWEPMRDVWSRYA